jgi:hypothetical protein
MMYHALDNLRQHSMFFRDNTLRVTERVRIETMRSVCDEATDGDMTRRRLPAALECAGTGNESTVSELKRTSLQTPQDHSHGVQHIMTELNRIEANFMPEAAHDQNTEEGSRIRDQLHTLAEKVQKIHRSICRFDDDILKIMTELDLIDFSNEDLQSSYSKLQKAFEGLLATSIDVGKRICRKAVNHLDAKFGAQKRPASAAPCDSPRDTKLSKMKHTLPVTPIDLDQFMKKGEEDRQRQQAGKATHRQILLDTEAYELEMTEEEEIEFGKFLHEAEEAERRSQQDGGQMECDEEVVIKRDHHDWKVEDNDYTCGEFQNEGP